MKGTVYIILFRGVGGKTQLPTKPLREKLTEAGFESATTYINSGNAIVRSHQAKKTVVKSIADLCLKQFAFDKAIFAITLDEWRDLIAANPFPAQAAAVPTTVHAVVLDDTPTEDSVKKLLSYAVPGEDLRIIGKVAYLHTPHGFGRSKLAEKFDKGIGVTNSARNWNTVLKLAELGTAAL